MEQIQYPIGRFVRPLHYNEAQKEEWIAQLQSLPHCLQEIASHIEGEQWDVPYREGGWTAKQVVHHIADSHMNAFVRCKLALTETNPTIKPYDENAWAIGADIEIDTSASLAIITGVHERWSALFQSMTEEDFQRTYYHPGDQEYVPLYVMLAKYAWHGTHHAHHIQLAQKVVGKKGI